MSVFLAGCAFVAAGAALRVLENRHPAVWRFAIPLSFTRDHSNLRRRNRAISFRTGGFASCIEQMEARLALAGTDPTTTEFASPPTQAIEFASAMIGNIHVDQPAVTADSKNLQADFGDPPTYATLSAEIADQIFGNENTTEGLSEGLPASPVAAEIKSADETLPILEHHEAGCDCRCNDDTENEPSCIDSEALESLLSSLNFDFDQETPDGTDQQVFAEGTTSVSVDFELEPPRQVPVNTAVEEEPAAISWRVISPPVDEKPSSEMEDDSAADADDLSDFFGEELRPDTGESEDEISPSDTEAENPQGEVPREQFETDEPAESGPVFGFPKTTRELEEEGDNSANGARASPRFFEKQLWLAPTAAVHSRHSRSPPETMLLSACAGPMIMGLTLSRMRSIRCGERSYRYSVAA